MLSKEKLKLVYPPRPPKQPVPTIYGLRTPLSSYRVCSSCHRGFKGRDPHNPSAPISRAFDKHVCFSGQPNPPDRDFFESHVQAFEASSRSPYFPVMPPSLTPQVESPWTSYRLAMDSRQSAVQTISIPDNYRVVDQFLTKEGWLKHVEGLDPAKLQQLVTLTQHDPLVPYLTKHCEAYLLHHQASLTSYYARRLISTRPRSVRFPHLRGVHLAHTYFAVPSK